jgi:PAS domain-containing protein
VHKLFARQLAKATTPSGEVDLDELGRLIGSAYDQADHDRRRTDRSISLMIEELDTLNRGLEKLVEVRTKALRDSETQLKAQNLRFEAAVNNMSQALLMFGPDHRLVICNERYRLMYGLSRDAALVGSTVRDLVTWRVAAGTFFAMAPEQYISDVKASTSSCVSSGVAPPTTGRTNPMVTDLGQARDRHQLQQIIAGLSEGVILIEPGQRIVWGNEAY